MFKKKEILKAKVVIVDPTTMSDLTTAEEYLKRGMAYYARKDYPNAEQDLKTALALHSDLVDAFYALGMVLKATAQKDEAVQAFETVLDFLGRGAVKNGNRTAMLRRLAKGHINQIRTGDWNLEKEIWQHVT